MPQLFHLCPFPHQPAPDLQISGHLSRLGQQLSLFYQIAGPSDTLELPPVSDRPSRKHDLWQTTCFEFFLGMVGSTPYWEFNLSPCGDWNVYHFDNYRRGMQEEAAIATLPYRVTCDAAAVKLNLSLDLSLLTLPKQPLQLAITAVIKTTEQYGGSISYWALAHTAAQPDFHQRNSFTLFV
jgi:hypothetical protein